MPCFDTEAAEKRDRDDVGAGLLCELIRAGKVDPNIWPELAAWWGYHQQVDAAYGRISGTRERPLSSFSPSPPKCPTCGK